MTDIIKVARDFMKHVDFCETEHNQKIDGQNVRFAKALLAVDEVCEKFEHDEAWAMQKHLARIIREAMEESGK